MLTDFRVKNDDHWVLCVCRQPSRTLHKMKILCAQLNITMTRLVLGLFIAILMGDIIIENKDKNRKVYTGISGTLHNISAINIYTREGVLINNSAYVEAEDE